MAGRRRLLLPLLQVPPVPRLSVFFRPSGIDAAQRVVRRCGLRLEVLTSAGTKQLHETLWQQPPTTLPGLHNLRELDLQVTKPPGVNGNMPRRRWRLSSMRCRSARCPT